MFDFAEPLLAGGHGSPEFTQKAMNLAMLFWNLAVLSDVARQQMIEKFTATRTPDDAAEFRAIAGQMVERHRLMFPEHHQRDAKRGP